MTIDYIGIDLGTTNSTVSYIKDGKAKSLKIGRSEIVPSAIFFESKENQIYGDKALKKMQVYPNSGIRVFKRMLIDINKTKKVEFLKKEEKSDDKTNKLYLIDTNIFIKQPNILDRLLNKEKAILSYTVLDELGFRKGDPNTKFQAEEARQSIEKYQLENKIEFRESDLTVIPNGCFKTLRTPNDQNDNRILSIAIIEKNNNVDITLVTGDNGLRIKANECGIKNQNIDEFLLEHPIVESDNDDYIELTGEKASAMFLKYLREESSKKLKSDIKKAVITVPANFNQIEVESTKRAGLAAGFEDIRIMKEPISAAIVYGVEEEVNKKILVYDFGGGTFDVSIIDVKENNELEVLASGGDAHLGGEDVTKGIVELIYDRLYDEYELEMESLEDSGLTEEEYIYNENKIRETAESIKILLSESQEENINLININIGNGEKVSYNTSITRKELEDEVLIDISAKAVNTVKQCLKKSDITMDQIDIIVLAGGTSTIPVFQENISKVFGKKPNADKDMATIVSQGAAIRADYIWGKENIDKDFIIHTKSEHDFGVALERLKFDTLIPEETTLPAKASKIYIPAKAGQESVSIKVFTRDRDCLSTRTVDDGIDMLDEIRISGLPTDIDNRNIKINVEFELDKEYMLYVNAKLFDANGKEIECKSLKTSRKSKL